MKLNFYMKTPYDKLAKVLQNNLITGPRWLTCSYMIQNFLQSSQEPDYQ